MEFPDILAYYWVLFMLILLYPIIQFYLHKQRGRKELVTKERLDHMLKKWVPEPLIPESPEERRSPKKHPALNPKRITSKIGKRITINDQDCLNLGTHNYLGLSNNLDIENQAIETIRKYGIGSCGPRSFYGTADAHLQLEERLAKFTNTEEAVVYSYGFSALASAIAAYCKRNDLIFVDERVNYALQKGLDASRGNIQYFKHNDIESLHEILLEQEKIDKLDINKAAKTKRFLIIEGIYMNTGNICPLPELLSLCKKYKLRIFIDESISFGSIGAHGKGVTEYFNIPISEIDMIMGSLEWALGSVGGFCVGTSFVIEHQRLSGIGYCFSASLPPLLTSAAIAALDIMENNLELFQSLKENVLAIDSGLKEIPMLECSSFAESPVKHVYLKGNRFYDVEEKLLFAISDKCIENNLGIILPAYLESDITFVRPSLRLCISASLKKSDINFALSTLRKCTEEVLSSL